MAESQRKKRRVRTRKDGTKVIRKTNKAGVRVKKVVGADGALKKSQRKTTNKAGATITKTREGTKSGGMQRTRTKTDSKGRSTTRTQRTNSAGKVIRSGTKRTNKKGEVKSSTVNRRSSASVRAKNQLRDTSTSAGKRATALSEKIKAARKAGDKDKLAALKKRKSNLAGRVKSRMTKKYGEGGTRTTTAAKKKEEGAKGTPSARMSKITSKIKKARSNGNTERVQKLRARRKSVRKKMAG